MEIRRRTFIQGSIFASAGIGFGGLPFDSGAAEALEPALPEGSAPVPVAFPHFPDRLHAFVWRNWSLAPLERMAEVLSAKPGDVLALGKSMGLPEPAPVGEDQWGRSYITIIRRNWHLLPYAQLLQLLGWTASHMAYMLREDDFLFIKLGSLKPKCQPLKFSPPSKTAAERAREIAASLREEFPNGIAEPSDPLFGFVKALSAPPEKSASEKVVSGNSSPRFCYSYFALYGDPLLDPAADPYPEGYLQRLANLGVNGVWLQAVLTRLAPFPWSSEPAADRQKRIENLRALVKRAARHGIGIYLYLNEPRAMPLSFFAAHPELKGVIEGDYAALCTSHREVRSALKNALRHLAEEVPDLAGFFTITASENLTNCWSHGAGGPCPLCGKRTPAEVIAEVNTLFFEAIQSAKSRARLMAWDWGWQDGWAKEIIERLPREVALQSVSEWSIPIERGGIKTVVGEYSISTIGPGPRATRHWNWARERGMKTSAKIQAGNTWELSAVPYIPALENVARHAANLKRAHVDGLMLGWTLGGYPSANLEVACQISAQPANPNEAIEEIVHRGLQQVASRRFGPELAPAVLGAWRTCSAAFSEFPFHGGLVYTAPMQFGPSNLLWAEPTGYRATMIGFPYDDLDSWRQVYPVEVFIAQFNKMADGFERAAEMLAKAGAASDSPELHSEIDIITAAALHFRSTANQARFVSLRRELSNRTGDQRHALITELKQILQSEIDLARRLHGIQLRDSRIGFEATNHYYYVGEDLLEKIINCRYLLGNWLPN